MQRVSVVGTTSSGKTTLGRTLAARLRFPCVELDAINWGPHWTPLDHETFRARVAAAITGQAWVVDGNYGGAGVRDVVWERADTVVWLDYAFRVVLWRLLVRTIRRAVTREELWSGNRESLRTVFLSRDSIFVWLLRTYWRRRRQFGAAQTDPAYAHLRWIRLGSPREAERWLASVPPDSPGTSG